MRKAFLSLLFGVATVTAFASPYSFSVQETGSGKPLILIPGMTCGGGVWDATVAQLKSKYHCYVLTLPGFAGQAPITGPYLPRVRDEIIAFVKDKHLDHPAVMGHSLGGFMVFYLGSAEPKLFGPLISVDGLPFLGSLFNPNATAQSNQTMADGIAKNIGAATPAQFEDQTKQALAQEITDPNEAAALLPICAKSDPGDVGQSMKEMMTIDLRDDIAKIQSPVLLIGAGQWSPNDQDGLRKSYESQIAKCPHAKLVIDGKSKHFIMLDDPEFFYKTINEFLAKN
jgi:pimeloyl-ACP methyl ester carboxylesterase